MSEMQSKFESIATKVDPKFEVMLSNEDRPGYLTRLVDVVDQMVDVDWESLAEVEQDWFNKAINAVKGKTAIAEFPDYVEVAADAQIQESEPRGREITLEAVKVGTDVEITLESKEVHAGQVVELGKRFIVLEDESHEENIRISQIVKIVTVEEGGGDTTPPAQEEILGNVIQAKDATEGKKYNIDVDGTITVAEFVRSTARGVVFEDPNGDRVRVALEDEIQEVAEVSESNREEKKAVSTPRTPLGVETKGTSVPKKDKSVSVHLRAKELICTNLGWTLDEVRAKLAEEGLSCKDSTLHATYRDAHILLTILKDLGKLS